MSMKDSTTHEKSEEEDIMEAKNLNLLKPPSTSGFEAVPDLKTLSLSVSFLGWRNADTNFESWVEKMSSLHKTIWEKGGVFEAIRASSYRIEKDTDLVLALAEKWSPSKESFVFSWGETSITLEDVNVLLGFSVSGSPVSDGLDSEGEGIKERLEKELCEAKGSQGYVTQLTWIERFMDSSHDLEHVAFLVAWLSYFVFPLSGTERINEEVFSIAIHLSRGVKVALGQAVLSKLYAELGLLKNHILAFGESKVTEKKIEVTGLVKLVQVWTWERFKELRPRPNQLVKGEPRLALWHEKHREVNDVRQILDNSKMDSSTSSSEEDVGAGPSSSKQKTKKGKGKGSNKKPTGKVRLTPTHPMWPKDVPDTFKSCEKDWSKKGVLREVMDQKDWDVCWSMALTVTMEGAFNVKALKGEGNRCPKLSPQHLINNVKKATRGSMKKFEGTRNFLVNNGLVNEEVCEFSNSIDINGCFHETPVTKIKNLKETKRKQINERELIKLVFQRPVVIVIESYQSFLDFKGDGIYRGRRGRKDVSRGRHALVVVGYGTTEDGIHYWIVQNSHGTGWGSDGYGKIIRQCSLKPNEPSLIVKVLEVEV